MPSEFVITVAVICGFSSFVQGFSGFGGTLFAVPLLSLMMNIHNVVPLSVLISLSVGPYLTWVNRKTIDYSAAVPMTVAGCLAVPLGVVALHSMSARTAGMLLGAAIILLVASQRILGRSVIGEPKAWKAAVTGVIAGLLGGAFNTAGPPVVAYLHQTTPPKQARATMYFVFLVTGVLTAIGHFFKGAIDTGILLLALAVCPIAVISAHFGGKLAERMHADRFGRIVTWLLVGLGAYMIGRSFYT